VTPAALDCLREHLDAENAHDLARIMATYVAAPRVTINGRTFAGVEAVRAFHDRFGFGGSGAFSAIRVEERRRHVVDRAVVIEQTLSGVHTGKWQGLVPTQKCFSLPVCTVYSFADDAKLAAEDVYFDASAISAQLGAAPHGR